MTGCLKNGDPEIIENNSEGEITSNFSEYNQYAQENNKPIIDFIKLTLSKPHKRRIVKNDEIVKIDDKKIYFYSKWHNLEQGDILVLKVFQPDGKLFAEEYSTYSLSSGEWKIHKTFLVENYLVPKFKGKWKYELFIKDKKVGTNDFILHNDKNIEEVEQKLVIR